MNRRGARGEKSRWNSRCKVSKYRLHFPVGTYGGQELTSPCNSSPHPAQQNHHCCSLAAWLRYRAKWNSRKKFAMKSHPKWPVSSQARKRGEARITVLIELRRLAQKVAKILNEGGSRRLAGPSCGFQETWRLMRRKTKKEKEEEVTCMKRESKTHGKKTWPRHAATHTLTHTHRQIDPHRKQNRCCN
jgi:hypothetical protein